MSYNQELVGLLGELVRTDSVNPSLVPGAGEGKVAERVVAWATGAGLSVEVLEQVPGRPSVRVRSRRTPARGGKSLMMCGHMDTVGIGAMRDPLSARVDGDRMYGRGVYDMKAGLVAALFACRDSREKPPPTRSKTSPRCWPTAAPWPPTLWSTAEPLSPETPSRHPRIVPS